MGEWGPRVPIFIKEWGPRVPILGGSLSHMTPVLRKGSLALIAYLHISWVIPGQLHCRNQQIRGVLVAWKPRVKIAQQIAVGWHGLTSREVKQGDNPYHQHTA